MSKSNSARNIDKNVDNPLDPKVLLDVLARTTVDPQDLSDRRTFVIPPRQAQGSAGITSSRVPILVVDDSAAKRLAIKAVLLPEGYAIVEADSGLAALRCIREQDFALILLDVLMSSMDGFETAALIRQRRQSELTPIIFITALAKDEINTDLYAGGAVDFLCAPVSPNELVAKVSVFAKMFLQARKLADQRTELEALNHELTAIARQDPLTGLRNRRALQEDIEALEARVIRYAHSYCIALFDIDHFKSYNDTYGHPAGDQILVIVASTLEGATRSGDTLYRYGGEEFLCILPEQGLLSGSTAVERMRASLERLAIPHVNAHQGILTVSVGLAKLDANHKRPADEVLKEADASLYRAKKLGRNRVESSLEPDVACHWDGTTLLSGPF